MNLLTAYNAIDRVATSLWLLIPLYAIGAIYCLERYTSTYAFGSAALACLLAGVMYATFLEYALHRFLFHFSHRRFVPTLVHQRHHKNQYIVRHGSVPLFTSATLIALSWLGTRAIIGDAMTYPFIAALCLSLIAHEWVHYATHHLKPKSRFGAFLKRSHAVHHYDPSKNFGLMTMAWDRLFGTFEAYNVAKEKDRERR